MNQNISHSLATYTACLVSLASCAAPAQHSKGPLTDHLQPTAAGCYEASTQDERGGIPVSRWMTLMSQPFAETVGTWWAGVLVARRSTETLFAVHPRTSDSGLCLAVYWRPTSRDSITIAWIHPPGGVIARLHRTGQDFLGKVVSLSDVVGQEDAEMGTLRLSPVPCTGNEPIALSEPSPHECDFD